MDSVEGIRAAEERLHTERKSVNEVVDLISVCESGRPRVRLAAIQACRSLFAFWADGGELVLHFPEHTSAASSSGIPNGEAQTSSTPTSSAIDTYGMWLHDKYARFVGVLLQMLQGRKTPLALRPAVLDSLLLLAACEVRCARPGKGAHLAALDNVGGVFRKLVSALVRESTPLPDDLLGHLREEHLSKIDVAYHLLKHILRLATLRPPQQTPSSQRLVELLLLITPPEYDVDPKQARFLLSASELRVGTTNTQGSGESKAAGTAPKSGTTLWPTAARRSPSCAKRSHLFCQPPRSSASLLMLSSALFTFH